MGEEEQWTHPDPEFDAAWAEEIRRRIRAVRAGEMRTRPIDEVLDEVDRLLADDELASGNQGR